MRELNTVDLFCGAGGATAENARTTTGKNKTLNNEIDANNGGPRREAGQSDFDMIGG